MELMDDYIPEFTLAAVDPNEAASPISSTFWATARFELGNKINYNLNL